MRFIGAGERAANFRSGYAPTLEDWNTPANQAMRTLQFAITRPGVRRLKAALSALSDADLDVNQVVLQDTINSWFHLAPFLISKASASSTEMFDTLMKHPGVDLNLQSAQVFDRHAHWYARSTLGWSSTAQSAPPATPVVKPFGHVFLIGWANAMGPPSGEASSYGYARGVARHQICQRLLKTLERAALDWHRKDSLSNNIAHELFARADGKTVRSTLPWLLSLGLDLSATNADGYTPATLARYRLSRERHNSGTAPADKHDIEDYEFALSEMESYALEAATPVVSRPPTPSASRGFRL